MLVYVDDNLVLSTPEQGIDLVDNAFRSRYEVRVSNENEWVFGVDKRWLFNSTKRRYGVELSQPLYIDGILHSFGMTNAKPVNAPMVESFWTALDSEADRSVVNEHFYQQIIGSLLYLALHTRLDILPTVSILSCFQKAPAAYCHRVARHVLRYLRGTYLYVLKY